jgi:hypothetical protein
MKTIKIEVITCRCDTIGYRADGRHPNERIEQDHFIYIVRAIDGDAEWREEYTDPERVRAFVRGVKAAASFTDLTVDAPLEWT